MSRYLSVPQRQTLSRHGHSKREQAEPITGWTMSASVLGAMARLVTGGESGASDNGKTNREDHDDSGDDAGGDEPLEHVEPAELAKQPTSHLRRLPSCQHETEDPRQLSELRDSISDGCMVDNDHGTVVSASNNTTAQSQAVTRGHAGHIYAQRSAARILGRRAPNLEGHLPPAKAVAAHRLVFPGSTKGEARLDNNSDGRSI